LRLGTGGMGLAIGLGPAEAAGLQKR